MDISIGNIYDLQEENIILKQTIEGLELEINNLAQEKMNLENELEFSLQQRARLYWKHQIAEDTIYNQENQIGELIEELVGYSKIFERTDKELNKLRKELIALSKNQATKF